MKAFTDHLDFRVTLLAVGMALCFGLIHVQNDKLALPVLLVIVVGTIMSPFPVSVLCLLATGSWLSLWIMAFYAGAQTSRFFVWGSVPLWLTVMVLLVLGGLNRPIAQNLWFWLPGLIFTVCSWQLAKLFFITKYFEQPTST